MKTKKEFANYFRREIEPGISANDKPALRQAWNDTIDGMCKDGSLPDKARDWSHPANPMWQLRDYGVIVNFSVSDVQRRKDL